MSIDIMRAIISKPYGWGWKQKVDKMPPSQVQAIYIDFKRRGLI